MIGLGRRRKKSNAPTMLQEISNNVVIIFSWYCAVDVVWNMKHDINVAVGIFHPRIGYQSYLHTYFFMLQEFISDIATVIYQYCDGLFNEKILIGRPDASGTI